MIRHLDNNLYNISNKVTSNAVFLIELYACNDITFLLNHNSTKKLVYYSLNLMFHQQIFSFAFLFIFFIRTKTTAYLYLEIKNYTNCYFLSLSKAVNFLLTCLSDFINSIANIKFISSASTHHLNISKR